VTLDYAERFARVLDHIDEHLDEELTVPALSAVANLSRFHFQRLFRRYLGLGVYAYVQQLRLRRAAYRLAFRESGILEIGIDAGYASHEAFTRAFRKLVGQPPSAFRDAPDWERWHETQALLVAARAVHGEVLADEEITVRTVAPTRVLAMEHHGDPAELGTTVRRFIAWRRGAGVSPAHATFNIAYTDPADVPASEFRFDIAVATDLRARDSLVEKVLAGGRCATFRHVGRDDDLWRKVGALDRWLATSGEQVRDAPLYVRRVAFFPDVPEHAAVSDVVVPLEETPGSPRTDDRGTHGDRSPVDPSTAESRDSAAPRATD
jgi:AraC family transcriptional regulator